MPIQTVNLAPGETQTDSFNVPANASGEYLVTLEMSDAALLDPATRIHYGLEIQQPDLSWKVYTFGDVQGDPANGFNKFGQPITPVRPKVTLVVNDDDGKAAASMTTAALRDVYAKSPRCPGTFLTSE